MWNCSYLEEDHGRDLLSGELLLLAKVLNLNLGRTIVVNNGEGPRLDVLLDSRVIEAATNQTPVTRLLDTFSIEISAARLSPWNVIEGGPVSGARHSLGIEDGVLRVHSSIVFGSITDQTLLVGEGNERRGGERTLLVGNDLNIGTLVGGHTRVGGT